MTHTARSRGLPILARSRFASKRVARSTIVPDVGSASPVMSRSSVVLPEPLGPTTAVMPGSKRRVVGEAKDGSEAVELIEREFGGFTPPPSL